MSVTIISTSLSGRVAHRRSRKVPKVHVEQICTSSLPRSCRRSTRGRAAIWFLIPVPVRWDGRHRLERIGSLCTAADSSGLALAFDQIHMTVLDLVEDRHQALRVFVQRKQCFHTLQQTQKQTQITDIISIKEQLTSMIKTRNTDLRVSHQPLFDQPRHLRLIHLQLHHHILSDLILPEVLEVGRRQDQIFQDHHTRAQGLHHLGGAGCRGVAIRATSSTSSAVGTSPTVLVVLQLSETNSAQKINNKSMV